MRIPYKVYPDSYGAPGSYLYIAALYVQIGLPVPSAPRSKRFEAVIDSGATRTLFRSDLALHLGLDLRAGEMEISQGIGGSESTYLHDIALYIPGGPVKIKVGFKERLPIAELLGMSGFFEFFKITFDPDSKACNLERTHRV